MSCQGLGAVAQLFISSWTQKRKWKFKEGGEENIEYRLHLDWGFSLSQIINPYEVSYEKKFTLSLQQKGNATKGVKGFLERCFRTEAWYVQCMPSRKRVTWSCPKSHSEGCRSQKKHTIRGTKNRDQKLAEGCRRTVCRSHCIVTYIWLVFMVTVGEDTFGLIGRYGKW